MLDNFLIYRIMCHMDSFFAIFHKISINKKIKIMV